MPLIELPSLEEEPCVVLDTEVSDGAGPVIELAIVGLRSGQPILSRRYGLPLGAPWNPYAERVHRIPRAALRGLPTCAEDQDAILDVLRGRVLIGHNLEFDARALARSLGRFALGESRRMCTLAMAQQHLPGLKSYKLASLAQALDVSFTGRAHSALGDTEATRQVYLAIRALVLSRRG